MKYVVGSGNPAAHGKGLHKQCLRRIGRNIDTRTLDVTRIIQRLSYTAARGADEKADNAGIVGNWREVQADREIGHLDRDDCHAGSGVLHRAFSLLIFNGNGELLLQQRAASKRLWPLYWSNSCCSHPRRAESMEAAIHRRLNQELGLDCPLQFLFKFQYQAQFDAISAERELCSVFIGRCVGRVKVNPDEIHDWRWVSPEALEAEIRQQAGRAFTPWFLEEWARIWREHRPEVHSLQ